MPKTKNKKRSPLLLISISILVFLLSAVLTYLYSDKYTLSYVFNVKVSPHATVKRDTSSNVIQSEAPKIDPSKVLGRTTTIESINPKLWGVFNGWRVSDFTSFESYTNTSMDYVATFVHWGNENAFPTELANYAKANGKTLVIFWEAKNYNNPSNNDRKYNYDSILAGKWDKYFASFAKSSKDFKGQYILIPFEEMNGNWSPWAGSLNGNTALKHKKAYRYIKAKFASAPNVKFGWTVNNISLPITSANSIGSYFPGGEYVDYVGVDGFNFDDPWVDFDTIFTKALTTLETYKKPIVIFSMASAEGSKKSQWLIDSITKISERSSIVGWIWFNEDKEKDWRLWSDTDTLATFQSLVNN